MLQLTLSEMMFQVVQLFVRRTHTKTVFNGLTIHKTTLCYTSLFSNTSL